MDKPRVIVVCSPNRYDSIKATVEELGYDDVLVVSNRYLPDDSAYIIDPPPDVIA